MLNHSIPLTVSRPYSFDKGFKIWITPEHKDAAYSDGDEVENFLLAGLQQCSDISSFSEELHDLIVDWPTEYHLHPVRHNLLRHFPFVSGDCILELGCGCGALTRYFGETGATVIAVESSRRRAAIAAERCRDLPNVTIYCDNLIDFQTSMKFTYVTLIGVLEYAQQYIPGIAPVEQCLQRVTHFMEADGTLLLAIENQFGLKYFSGCSEDHTGSPYFGINDLYSESTAITFGRQELTSKLHGAGYHDTTFFYPFPDYKLPSLVLSEVALDRKDFHFYDLLPRIASRDYAGQRPSAFHEALAWPRLAHNRMLADLSNSFLVAARNTATCTHRASWLAASYSSGRLSSFATATTFISNGNEINVNKTLLSRVYRRQTGTRFAHCLATHTPYISGRNYGAGLLPLMAKGGDCEVLARWLQPWVVSIATQASSDAQGTMALAGSLIDAIPTNMVQTSSGALVAIDLEWEASDPIPFKWVLLRGSIYALVGCPLRPGLQGLSVGVVIQVALANLGYVISETDLLEANSQERVLQTMVCGTKPAITSLIDLWNSEAYPTPHTLHQEIYGLKKEIIRVKSSFSWQITKPVRLLKNIGLYIFRLCGIRFIE